MVVAVVRDEVPFQKRSDDDVLLPLQVALLSLEVVAHHEEGGGHGLFLPREREREKSANEMLFAKEPS